ncbi:plasmid recombination protein [Agathobaculum sp.]|uniref:plasmid recombination protein n=1 Tax=Agathobaculum sp. TaxID=2048138 RepID=UPI00352234FD
MARGDGIHRTSARNARMKDADIGNAQAHNEREKSSYVNQDIVPERTPYNVHFKTPTAGYKEMFEQMCSDGVISTRGLKADAEKLGELIFDVNSAYFFNHSGYEFAKQFYADAYKAAIKIMGGEQYILSAVMHADERNRAMSDALGQDVYHYHLHVVYIPVVEKQILWSKRSKDKSLVETVKETIQQVSMSKKWASKPALDENDEPILSSKGKPILKKSYSVLQDDFFRYIRDAGYDDVERGERGSSEEHLTVTQFKVQQEQVRLAELTEQNRQQEQQAATLNRQIEKIQNQQVNVAAIEKIEAKSVPFSSKVAVEREDFERLSTLAKKYITAEKKEFKLQKALDAANRLIAMLKEEIAGLKQELSEYKSVRSKLRTSDLERENAELRGKVQHYEDVIQRNNLWHFFRLRREKAAMRDDAR